MHLNTIRKLMTFCKRRKLVLSVVLLLGVCAAFCEGLGAGLIVPLFKCLIPSDNIASDNRLVALISAPFQNIVPSYRMIAVLCVFLGLIVLKNILLWLNEVTIKWLMYKVRFDIAKRVFSQILDVGYRFIQSKKQGELFTWIHIEPSRAAESLGSVLQIVTYCCIMLIYVVVLSALAWKLAAVALILSVLLAVSMNKLSRMLRHFGMETTRTSDGLNTYMMESLQSMRMIRIFGTEEHEKSRQENVWIKFHTNALRKAYCMAIVSPLSETFTTFLVVIILIFFSMLMSYDPANVLPLLVAFLFVMGRIQTCAGKINQARMGLASDIVGVERVMSALDKKDKPYVLSGSRSISKLNDGIKFDGVSYRYPASDEFVINDVTFHIPKGEVTALVGISGAGKSTILDLILRLDDPGNGRIIVDGYDLKNYRLNEWRDMIGMVDQETFIFNASVTDNIRYGFLEANEDDVVMAAELANASEFIDLLPHRYNTMLGDRGTRLSGGQRQRIAIARAVLRKAQVMIYDEATSSLDSVSEKLIHNSIKKLSVDRTVIIVAHRLSTVVHADNIVILDDGKIAEMGTHDALLSNKGKYYSLYKVQSEGMSRIL